MAATTAKPVGIVRPDEVLIFLVKPAAMEQQWLVSVFRPEKGERGCPLLEELTTIARIIGVHEMWPKGYPGSFCGREKMGPGDCSGSFLCRACGTLVEWFVKMIDYLTDCLEASHGLALPEELAEKKIGEATSQELATAQKIVVDQEIVQGQLDRLGSKFGTFEAAREWLKTNVTHRGGQERIMSDDVVLASIEKHCPFRAES